MPAGGIDGGCGGPDTAAGGFAIEYLPTTGTDGYQDGRG